MLADPSGSDEFRRIPFCSDAAPVDLRQPAARETFWMALNKLPEELKTVVLLRQQMDLSFVEIAERMQHSTEVVQKLWGRALIVLGEKLEEMN